MIYALQNTNRLWDRPDEFLPVCEPRGGGQGVLHPHH
jgi:hypothetical protein